MAAEPIMSKLSIRSLTAEAENNVNQLLSLTTDKNEIKNMAQHYQAYAVQIASVIGQVDPEIRKWMKDLPESSVIEARSMLAKFEASRDETRNLRDLYQVYREQIRRLERAWRRGEKSGSDMFTSEPNPEDGQDNSGSKGVIGMVSAGLMGLFGADSKKSQDSKASCSSSECLVKDQEKRFGGSQPALEKNRDEFRVTTTDPYHREVLSDTNYMRTQGELNRHPSGSDRHPHWYNAEHHYYRQYPYNY